VPSTVPPTIENDPGVVGTAFSPAKYTTLPEVQLDHPIPAELYAPAAISFAVLIVDALLVTGTDMAVPFSVDDVNRSSYISSEQERSGLERVGCERYRAGECRVATDVDIFCEQRLKLDSNREL